MQQQIKSNYLSHAPNSSTNYEDSFTIILRQIRNFCLNFPLEISSNNLRTLAKTNVISHSTQLRSALPRYGKYLTKRNNSDFRSDFLSTPKTLGQRASSCKAKPFQSGKHKH